MTVDDTTPDRARALVAFTEHIKSLRGPEGSLYDGNERTLLVIGFDSGWRTAEVEVRRLRDGLSALLNSADAHLHDRVDPTAVQSLLDGGSTEGRQG